MLSAADVSDRRKPVGAVRGERSQSLAMWAAGLVVGARTLPKEPILGLKRLLLPVSYWRAAEFAYAWEQLDLPRGSRILDVGSPKDLAAMLARHKGYEVVATDILPEAVLLSQRYARAQGLDGRGPGRVHSEVRDGRALPYADNSFDAAFSVSVLEHIPDRGDSAAMLELVRVVKPGGVIVVTVPYDQVYRETFVDGPVYERRPSGAERLFFERHYDRETLGTRLLASGRADLVHMSLWGEGAIRMEALLTRLGPLRAAVSPLEGPLSTLLLRQVEPNGPGRPMAAFFTLRRR